jgi:uncharacterized protein YbjT (DUF2867 family)
MILVTGATGNIGREVVRRLVAGGRRPRVLTRDPARAAGLGAVEVAQGDLNQAETLAPALAGVSRALLLGRAMELPAIAERFVAAAKGAGVGHLVLISSATISFAEPSRIARWHLEAEEIVKASGMEWTMVRPGNYASNTLRWAGTIKAQGKVFAPGGDGQSAVIDPRDIGAVAHVALTGEGQAGKTHVITGPELMTPREQVRRIGVAIGREVTFVEVPFEAAQAGIVRAGLSPELAEAIVELIRAAAAGRERLLTDGVREVTGVAARPFDEWARDHAHEFKAGG